MNTDRSDNNTFEINAIRDLLSEDFSKNKTDRVIMALRSTDPSKPTFDLHEIRPLLADDFSLATVNRVLVTLKLAPVLAY
jgi:hypothetical protein